MLDLPDNHIMYITQIYPSQEEAVKVGEELVENGYMFLGDGQYHKAKQTYIIGYDPDIPEMAQKAEIEDTRSKKKK